MLIVIELINPVIGLNALPVRIFQLLIKYLEGINPIEDCWISNVERVAFMNIIQNGKIERIAKKVQTMYTIVLYITRLVCIDSCFTFIILPPVELLYVEP